MVPLPYLDMSLVKGCFIFNLFTLTKTFAVIFQCVFSYGLLLFLSYRIGRVETRPESGTFKSRLTRLGLLQLGLNIFYGSFQ